MRSAILSAFVLYSLFSMAVCAGAQVDVSGWPKVHLPATVTDKHGTPITILTPEMLIAKEDGQSITITRVLPANEPQSVCVLIDTSGSSYANIDETRAAAQRLLAVLPAGDEACVVAFDLKAILLQPLTEDRALLQAVLAKPMRTWGATILYDSLLAVAQLMQRTAKHRSRAIVLLTDGDDNASRISRVDLARQLDSLQAPAIYFLCWPKPDRTAKELKSLVANSGGLTYLPKNARELMTDVDQLAAVMGNRFMLEYESPTTAIDGHKHTLEMRAADRAIQVQTASEFTAPAQ